MENIMYHIEYYISCDEEAMLFATLIEDPSLTFFFDKEKNKWVFSGCSLKITKEIRKLEKVSKEEAIIITMGVFVEPLYEDYGYKIYEEEVVRDIVEEMVKGFIDFAIYHYKYGTSKENVLNLKTSILDEAYHCDYYGLVEANFEEFNKRKQQGLYKEVNIVKENNDYLITLDESILEN